MPAYAVRKTLLPLGMLRRANQPVSQLHDDGTGFENAEHLFTGL